MATSLQDQIAAAVSSFKDPRTMKMPVSNTDEFRASSPTYFPLSGRPVQTTPYPALDRSKPMSVNYWPQYGANDPSGGVPYLAAPMPAQTGTGNLPGMGAYAQYGATPNTGGDPNRLASGSLPFINKPPIDITVPTAGAPQYALNPLAASIPMPRGRPGMNIQPFDNQGNLMDPGNAGYVDPMAAYAPQPAPSPAAAAINGLSPLTASERIKQPIPGASPPPQTFSPSQEYQMAINGEAYRAQTQDRSGFGTDGYVRDSSGNVFGRNAKYAGMTPSQMYDRINGNGPVPGTPGTDRNGNRIDGNPDNSTFSGSTKKYLRPGDGQYIHRDPSTGKQTIRAIPAGYEVYHPRGAGSSALRQVGSGGGGSIGGAGAPRTGGPMLAPARSNSPVTGGIMTPARARPRTAGPIMRRA